MQRVLILVLDSLGIGGAPDAAAFGDDGADTLGHIAETCATAGKPLSLPNLSRLGLGLAAAGASGKIPPGLHTDTTTGAYANAIEISRGKDTPSGHWELAGVPVLFDWDYFPTRVPCFPETFSKPLIDKASLSGLLGNCHASGTEIIVRLGEQHLQTGQPIIYTSADSVVQIAAHESGFGLQRLYDLCQLARELLDQQGLNVGRVIARPFIGNNHHDFQRTANRRDYAVPPPAATLLEQLVAAGGEVLAVGKIADIFAHQGISKTIKADDNMALFDATLAALQDAGDQSLIFTNFVDFDMHYGHRRDVTGYAAALEAFDRRLPELEALLQADDIVIITADHGNDPTWPGTDHTREQVPVLLFGPKIGAQALGQRSTMADIGQTIARHLHLPPLDYGVAML